MLRKSASPTNYLSFGSRVRVNLGPRRYHPTDGFQRHGIKTPSGEFMTRTSPSLLITNLFMRTMIYITCTTHSSAPTLPWRTTCNAQRSDDIQSSATITIGNPLLNLLHLLRCPYLLTQMSRAVAADSAVVG